MNKNYSLSELPQIASQIIASTSNKTLLFYGEMGVGKTTLIKEICKQLGVLDNISSPTFSLVNEYKTKKNKTVFHFDFYRIKNENEALDIGIEDYFYDNHWCFIEWPQNIKNLLPLEAVEIHLSNVEDGKRNIHIK
ncbi:MAG: tRNA (adenosine(37)-N6)-threonylcarbamoyltransferase complex ATPase subunit type 1 TsaE [Flavobacteriia bacterium]|nr:tRNA (adenosine(37)-N6)-threonylcarbamoyltransferase complex ATPase subunit type 1 TsaE [Flavobacteriia bacterium]OIP45236.1 MAG: tRNA (adenosine(37)-N6)-threonylcarbamoyltransferase complex ATPase subunit type 1 TsaE [Flavobacteriaceae bacterium CG2_30_31_66]PIV97516.1 MAG: tRNA (adenosine(37)-N6)-threonylcarbamoyltransferase complex ATPase subunit type 1 TsaE [Flavobacteriaceae bacterium CG17_big_fil_post_rev_8_21_14_2_50_31_13]PIX13036.1 MAG: tRNA (adenosine(37)-N6)-threonylcarbamoyltransf